MEDTHYLLDPVGVLPATDLLLTQRAVDQIERNGATLVTDVQRFHTVTA